MCGLGGIGVGSFCCCLLFLFCGWFFCGFFFALVGFLCFFFLFGCFLLCVFLWFFFICFCFFQAKRDVGRETGQSNKKRKFV